jgi:muramoyltetrapeptide carboxypeptidase LdcA involved in peptidoglycan recycling
VTLLIKPRKLAPGDTVAAVSLSWGGPGAIPARYEIGKRQFSAEFGVAVVETRHALRDPAWLADNPEARANDLMEAFANPSIHGIISTIGGDDSVRLLPFVDRSVIAANPKVFLGYSDTTVSHLACYAAGLTSFYGPAFMAGFAENCGMHQYLVDSVRKTLFSSDAIGLVTPNQGGWTVEHLDWQDPANQQRRRQLAPADPWRFLQGRGAVGGRLIGGCIEVLNWLRGTSVWPALSAFDGAILFLETSEEGPSPTVVERELRVYAAMGILGRIGGLLFGRPGGNVPTETFARYDTAILRAVREAGRDDLPIVTGMDFGHTDPLFVLPYGVMARIDCDRRQFLITEAGVSD